MVLAAVPVVMLLQGEALREVDVAAGAADHGFAAGFALRWAGIGAATAAPEPDQGTQEGQRKQQTKQHGDLILAKTPSLAVGGVSAQGRRA